MHDLHVVGIPPKLCETSQKGFQDLLLQLPSCPINRKSRALNGS